MKLRRTRYQRNLSNPVSAVVYPMNDFRKAVSDLFEEQGSILASVTLTYTNGDRTVYEPIIPMTTEEKLKVLLDAIGDAPVGATPEKIRVAFRQVIEAE